MLGGVATGHEGVLVEADSEQSDPVLQVLPVGAVHQFLEASLDQRGDGHHVTGSDHNGVVWGVDGEVAYDR